MMTPHLQLLQGAEGAPGELGFKLTGRAKDGRGSIRIWLRRAQTWSRALNPRILSQAWDVRVSVRVDSSFTLLSDFSLADLEGLLETYEFPLVPGGLDALPLNGDPIHDRVLVWARQAIGGATQEEPTPYKPQRLEVRYSPATAKSRSGARMPQGRSVSPFRPMQPFTPTMNRPMTVAESLAGLSGSASQPSSAPASAASSSSSPASAAAPAVPPRRPLTSRLAAIREQVEKEGGE